MARSLNRAQLIGNLGADPELRSTPSGTSVCTLRIATTESYKDRNGEWKEATEWHNVVMWDKLAEIADKYLTKGKKIFIEGRLQTRSYEKEGVTRYITEVVANQMIMLDGGRQGDSYGQAQASTPDSTSPAPDSEDEDDIPF